jgi:hypothetical protein
MVRRGQGMACCSTCRSLAEQITVTSVSLCTDPCMYAVRCCWRLDSSCSCKQHSIAQRQLADKPCRPWLVSGHDGQQRWNFWQGRSETHCAVIRKLACVCLCFLSSLQWRSAALCELGGDVLCQPVCIISPPATCHLPSRSDVSRA